MEDVQMIHLKINNLPVSVPKGTKILQAAQSIGHSLQQPFGSRGGTADTHPVSVLEPSWIYLLQAADDISAVVHAQAKVAEDLPVGRCAPGHE